MRAAYLATAQAAPSWGIDPVKLRHPARLLARLPLSQADELFSPPKVPCKLPQRLLVEAEVLGEQTGIATTRKKKKSSPEIFCLLTFEAI